VVLDAPEIYCLSAPYRSLECNTLRGGALVGLHCFNSMAAFFGGGGGALLFLNVMARGVPST